MLSWELTPIIESLLSFEINAKIPFSIWTCCIIIYITSILAEYFSRQEMKLDMKPQVFALKSSFSSFISNHMKSLKTGYKEPWILRLLGPNIHFLLSAIVLPRVFRSNKIRFSRELLITKDGGLIAIDWILAFQDFDMNSNELDDQENEERIVMIIADTCDDTYAHLHLAIQGMKLFAHKMFIFTPRGKRGIPLISSSLPSYSDPSDLREAIDFVLSTQFHQRKRKCPSISCVAFSSGADLLMAYMGAFGSSSHIDSAVCISPLFQPKLVLETPSPSPPTSIQARDCFEFPMTIVPSGFVSKVKLLLFKMFLFKHINCFQEFCFTRVIFEGNSLKILYPEISLKFSLNHLKRQEERTKMEFEKHEITRDESYKSQCKIQEYWRENDPLRDVDDVSGKVMFIKSNDDPMVPDHIVPYGLFKSYPNLILVSTLTGSHSGFISSLSSHSYTSWAEDVAIEFLIACWKFDNNEKREKFPSQM